MQTYLSTMSDIGVETWIMHGSLLGWWWNRKIMPWDADVDVQMSYWSMKFLADFYNMTIHHYKLPGIEKGRDYLHAHPAVAECPLCGSDDSSSDGIGDIVMQIRGVVNGITTTPGGATFQRAELGGELGMIQQFNTAAVQ